MNELAGSSLEFANQTVLHPVGVGVLVLCCIYMLIARKDHAILPLLLLMLVIPSAQRVSILAMDFSFIRIGLLVVLVRMLMKRENQGVGWQKSDSLVLAYVIWGIVAYGILTASVSGFVTRAGYMLEAGGAYTVARVYVRDLPSLVRYINFLGLLSVVLASFFIFENSTGRNLFSVFGGVHEYTQMREGKLRCQGPYSHPIIAGVVWIGVLPWFLALPALGYTAWRSATFVVSASIIVVLTASSTPIAGFFAVFIGIAGFFLRTRVKQVLIVFVSMLVSLQLAMSQPIWHLLARVDLVGGSTGWHRFLLIDSAFRNFTEWFVVGLLSTRHWGRGMRDITNQYILEGLRGGIISLVLFLWIFGSILRGLINSLTGSVLPGRDWVIWMAVTVLLVNLFCFLGISYFGQAVGALFLALGVAASLGTMHDHPAPTAAPQSIH